MIRGLSLASALTLTACGGNPMPLEPVLGHVVDRDGTPHIEKANAGSQPGNLLFVHAPAPEPGQDLPAVVAIARTASRKDQRLTLEWLCPADAKWAGLLATTGLPTAPVTPEPVAPLGRCWTRSRPALESEWTGGTAPVVALGVGTTHGVKSGDRYALYGTLLSETDSTLIDSFDIRGDCTVIPGHIKEAQSLCQLDESAESTKGSQAFDERAWIEGGYAHSKTAR